MLANIVVIGNIGRDAETRHTASGTAITNFSVAHTTKRGEKEITTWYKVQVWGAHGEAIAEYATKGRMCAVAGELWMETYTNRDGETLAQLVINATSVRMIGKGPDREKVNDAPKKTATRASDMFPPDEEDIPF